MKTIYVLAMFFFATNLWSQQTTQKNDIIVLNSGQLLQAQVTRVTGDIVSYQYPGETVQNEVEQRKIDRIVFASGRTQDFSSAALGAGSQQSLPIKVATPTKEESTPAPQVKPNTVTSRPSARIAQSDIYLLPEYEENSVAVLPINFTKNSAYDSGLAAEATKFAANYLTQQAGSTALQIQNVNNTVNNLINRRISQEQVKSASPEELLRVLNTHYAVKITISETQRERKAPKTKELVSSYFDQTAKLDVEETPELEEDASKIAITLEVYDANGSKTIYDTTISESRNSDQNETNEQTLPHWRSTLSYVLNGYLNAQKN